MTCLEVVQAGPELPDVKLERIVWVPGRDLRWNRSCVELSVLRIRPTSGISYYKAFIQRSGMRKHHCDFEIPEEDPWSAACDTPSLQ